MKSIWQYFTWNYPIWLCVSLIITLVSLLFIFLANAENILGDNGDVLFGIKAFHLFSVILMWVWVMIVYKNRSKSK